MRWYQDMRSEKDERKKNKASKKENTVAGSL